jgi:hypothetical protein
MKSEHCCFLFWRWRIQMSARRSGILAEVKMTGFWDIATCTLMMQAVSTCETSVYLNETTQRKS